MPPAQPDLFGTSLLPGLTLQEDIIDKTEEQELIRRIDAAPLSPFRFHQWTGKRLTHSYGWTYDFETGTFAPTEPIPEWLQPLKRCAARFAELQPGDLVQALIIRYGEGAGIGWHRDWPVFEHVIGISLGAPVEMRFRRRRDTKFERASARLAPRSIYHLQGEVRNDWEHSIAEMTARRWSITFRSVR